MTRTFMLAALSALFVACGGGESEAPDVEAAPPMAFAGTYRVTGQTVETNSGNARDITGLVVLVQEGGSYTATFDLETLFPTPDGPTQAQVVGKGEGRVASSSLIGTAETQIILAQVPGVDPAFSFLPRAYGPRLMSSSNAMLNDDGSLTVEIENKAEGGESYTSTKTTLRGVRIDPTQP